MPRPKPQSRPERVIALIAGESGTGKSFFIGGLRNALIFDTDIGGGLAYLDARIARNGSERVEVGSYLDVIQELNARRGKMAQVTTLAIDHLTTLQQEAVLRYNPQFQENTFGREHDRANKEWRKVRDLVRWGDFNLICTSHLKAKYEAKIQTGVTTDASKNIDADFTMVLHLRRGNAYPSQAQVVKWRRDPDDERGLIPATFPFTLDRFLELHGYSLEGNREEVEVASAEQVKELERLLSVVKLPEGTTEKWLAKAKAETWSELTADQIVKCIEFTKGLITNGKEKES